MPLKDPHARSVPSVADRDPWHRALASRVAGVQPSAYSNRRNHGFTLLELLVVIAILGLLIGLVAPSALRQLGFARGSIAKQSIERLGGVLDIYKLDTGRYPSTEQGLKALVERPMSATVWNGPYVTGAAPPVDPWNRAWIYRNPSSRPGRDYDLCSQGPDPQNPQGQICNP